MNAQRIRRLFAAGVAVLLGAATGASGATDEGGIPLGPVLLHPELTLSLTHDDNVTLASDGGTDDWYTVIAPGLRLVLPVARFRLQAEGGLEARTYAELEEENATNWYVGAAAGARFPGGLDFEVSERYEEEYLVASQEYGPGETSTLNTLRATAGYRVRDALRLQVGAGRTDYEYELSRDRDRVETALRGDAFWRLRSRTSAIVGAGVTRFAYDENQACDNEETRLALGLAWEATSRSTGLLEVGYEWKRYEREDRERGIEDGDYFVVLVQARHDFTSRTAAQLELSRGSDESDFVGNPYYLRSEAAAGLSHRFTTKIHGQASLRYGVDEYPHAVTYDNPYDPGHGPESGERTDRTLEGRVAVGFDATRWLTLEAAWETERRTSNFETFEYVANRVILSALAAF